MASQGSRGPIKAGSGYVDIIPKLNQKALKALRAELLKSLTKAGEAGGKGFSEGMTKGMAGTSKAVGKIAKQAKREVEKAEVDSKKTINRIQKEITKLYGTEAAKRFKEAQKAEKKKQKLVEETSAATKTALKNTIRAEETAAKTAATRWKAAERARIAAIKERERAAIASEKAQAAAEKAHAAQQAAMRRAMRDQLLADRRARQADLRSQVQASRDQTRALQNQLRGYRQSMADMTTSTSRGLAGVQKQWKAHGHSIEMLGTQATETGKLITTNLLGPLALVAGALTTIGVKSADSLKLGQMGLMGSGVTAKDSLNALTKIRQYGVDTPYAIEDMQTYMVRYIRALESHDKDFKSSNVGKRNAVGKRAANKAGDLVMMVGDNAARAGNLDPSMVSRGMYAIDMMLDAGRVNTRNLKQFAMAAGVSVQEMALMLGFEDKGKKSASAQMLMKMANAKKTGGVQANDLVDNLLSDWKGKGGSKGRGREVGTATISGRLQQFKEQSQVSLGNLFAKPDKKTGLVEYTGLGESIMGKKTEIMKRDKKGELTGTGKYEYKGGLINDVQDLAKGQKQNIVKLLKTFFEALSTLVKQITKVSDFFKAHPKWADAFAGFVKLAAKLAPFIIALGLGTKVLGKVVKLLGSAFTPIRMLGKGLGALGKGARGAVRTGRQLVAGSNSALNGNGFRNGYRDQRTQTRGGDTRGPIRRTVDRARGNDSRQGPLNNQIRDTEQAIREAQERTEALQRQLRELSNTSITQLVNQFGGGHGGSGGGNSLTGAANNTQTQVNNTQTQVRQLAGMSLNGVQGEFDSLEKKVKDVVQEVQKAASEVRTLDSRKLGSLRNQQIETTKNQADKLKNELNHAGDQASNLNGKKLTAFRKQVTLTTSAVSKLHQKLKDVISRVTALNGKSLGSIKGRFRGGKGSLYSAVSDVYNKLGTSKSGLNGRIVDLNGRSLARIVKAVRALRDALSSASKHANTLDNRINDVNNDSSFGGGSGGKKKKKYATGGVLPGYAPGVDSIPAMLSPGEAVLRPEVAKHIGAQQIDAWNAAAMNGKLKGYRTGTSGASIFDRLSIGKEVKLFGTTLGFDAAGARVDARTPTNLVRFGSRQGGRTAGSGVADKLRGTLEYFTEKLPQMLRKAPSGWGKLAGLVGSAIAPTAGQLFWKDIWKGNGNILNRTNQFMGDLLNPKNIWKMLKDAGSGIWDTIKSSVSMAKDLATDPIGTIKDSVKGMYNGVKDTVHGVIDQVASLREIMANPGAYAKQTLSEFMTTAKDSLPNTKGLFKFADGGVVPGYSPDDDRVHALLSPGEGVLRPEAVRALGVTNLGLLNKAAKNGEVKNLKEKSGEIIPAPDADAFKTAADKIDKAMTGSQKAAENTKSVTSKAWAEAGSKVKSSAESTMVPAMKKAASQASSMAKGTKSSMGSVKSSAASAASGTSKSFGSMKSGLKSLQGSFHNSQKNIDKSMDKIPGSISSNVHKAISYIQSKMIGPVNSKLLGPAKLSKIGNMPGYATGGVVPGYAPGKDSVLAMLSPGESILRPEVTKALGEGTVHALNKAAMSGQIQAFAKGGVVQSWSDAIPGMFSETASPILKNLVKAFGANSGGYPHRIGGVGVKKAGPAISKILEGKDEKYLESMMSPTGSGVKRWAPLVLRVLKELGISSKWLSLVLHRIGVESGGNPKAINNWDINAKNGHPSQGLMQTIPGTFNAYAGKYRKLGITNPLASIYAGLNYATHRYGSHWTSALSGSMGYANGTRSASAGVRWVGEKGPELMRFKGGEQVLTNSQSMAAMNGRNYEVHIHEAKHENTTQATIRGLQYIDTMYGNRI